MAEELEADSESWDEIQVTAIFNGVAAIGLVVLFEITRRIPAVAAVFDRRRDSHAYRTPPPLLRNAILEWLFLSNKESYRDYAFLSHMRDVILERRRQKKKQRIIKNRGRTKDEAWTEDKPNYTNMFESPGSDENFPHKTESIQITGRSKPDISSNYEVQRKAAKLTHYLTPNVIEFNGRRLPVEIGAYAMAGDLTERQLDEYEQMLLDLEKREEEEFVSLRKEMIAKYGKEGIEVDLEEQVDGTSISSDGSDKLILPPRESRLRFLGFQHGKMKKRKHFNPHSQSPPPTPPSAREAFRQLSRFFSTKNISNQSFSSPVSSPSPRIPSHSNRPNIHNPELSVEVDLDVSVNHHVNRHLKSTSISDTRPLTPSDREMLRCIGLDYFVMIRFLRFCFDIAFYPFLVSCATLIPTYYTNNYDGVNEINENLVINEQTDGYFRFTINRLERSSNKLWITWGFTFFFYCFILRRLWIEWETFIALRFEFLANGDADYEEALAAASHRDGFKKKWHVVPDKDDVHLHLEQFRNSCIVEFIPQSHRRDQELFQFFDAVFPNQVKRAEVLINTPTLSDLISKRQTAIELYEKFYAKQRNDKQKYSLKTEGCWGKFYNWCFRCSRPKKQPEEPMMRDLTDSDSYCSHKLFFSSKMVKALPHLLRTIEKLNHDIDAEYQKIMEEKQGVEDRDAPMYQSILDAKYAGAKSFLTGVGGGLTCSTGFVEFKTLTAKQSAIQCNLTGTTGYMVTRSAPDPRDIIWSNATVQFRIIYIKRLQFNGLLITGALFWSVVVSAITSVSDLDSISRYLPAVLVPEVDTYWYNLIQGYLPVLILEMLMKVVPIILGFIARQFIRFKTKSEIDQFVFKWHLAFRVANLIIIIVKHQFFKTLDLLRKNPQAVVDSLVTGIAFASQFFLNNVITATVTELLFELFQFPKMIYHLVLHIYITVEATSKRVLDELRVPESIDWGDNIPPFIFGLLIAITYSPIVPVVTGVCAVYFYLAIKVHTHQALFVYARPYEGGGMIMYQLNQSIFTIIYVSIVIFSVLFSLKKDRTSGLMFLILLTVLTVLVHVKITEKFVKPSITLAVTNARIIDEENFRRQELSRKYQEYKTAKRERKKRETKVDPSGSVEIIERKFNHAERNKKSKIEIEHVDKTYMPESLFASKSERKSITSSLSSPTHVRFRGGGNTKLASFRTSDSRSRSTDSYEDKDFYLYRQPQLNKSLWETKARPYWY